MEKYFNVRLEFDQKKVDEIIHNAITHNRKGYVCSVERNVISTAYHNETYRNIINSALVNICDGSIVAGLIGLAHKKPLSSYIGADLFIKYINKRCYTQYFLGNTDEILDGLRQNLSKLDPQIESMQFESLPFRDVNNFDYRAIASKINLAQPDIIWVSLGAPKQEEFMYNLQPFLNRGIMFGFGAIFNFYAGDKRLKRAPRMYLILRLEWLYRILQEPKKNLKRNWRFLKIIPVLFRNERYN